MCSSVETHTQSRGAIVGVSVRPPRAFVVCGAAGLGAAILSVPAKGALSHIPR